MSFSSVPSGFSTRRTWTSSVDWIRRQTFSRAWTDRGTSQGSRAALPSSTCARLVGALFALLVQLPSGAAEPVYELVLRPVEGGAHLVVVPESGTHLSREAPAALEFGGKKHSLAGDFDGWSLRPAPRRGAAGEVRFSLCDDALTWCKPVRRSLVFGATLTGSITFKDVGTAPSAGPSALSEHRTGVAPVASPASAPSTGGAASSRREHLPTHFPGAVQDDADAAFARAREKNQPVLIDFYGVWCPPCQLLVAQGLGDARARSILEKVVVLQMDADQATSWALKSRYQVTGYPTVILTMPSGEELGRMIGFEDADSFVSWLGRTVASGKPLAQWVALRRGGDRSPAVLLGLARALIALGLEEEAVPLYREALPALEGEDLLEARLALLAHAAELGEEAEALVQAEALTLLRPVPPPVPLALADAARPLEQLDRAAARQAGQRLRDLSEQSARRLAAQPGSSLLQQALAWEVVGAAAASRKDTAGAKQAARQGADLLLQAEKALSGPLETRYDAFRGEMHLLLDLLESAERYDEAQAAFARIIAAYPKEFTWHYRYGIFLSGQSRLPEAREELQRAWDCSYGDNRLRAVGRLAEVQVRLGQKEDARTLLNTTLSTLRLPDDPTVRTHRYAAALQRQLEELEAGGNR